MAVTTEAEIRNTIQNLITRITPAIHSANRFAVVPSMTATNFTAWCEANPATALRRFQVRTLGDTAPPSLTNSDVESVAANFVISIAYPYSSFNNAATMQRDDAMDADKRGIERTIGLYGKVNFPDATWLSSSTIRAAGDSCDYLVINQTMLFYRTV